MDDRASHGQGWQCRSLLDAGPNRLGIGGQCRAGGQGLEHRFRASTDMCRFPVYAGTGNDECPDFDHFGSGSTALQRMLVQEGQGKILLLPAWPANWDVDFKLRVSQSGVITGTVKDGRLVTWENRSARAGGQSGGDEAAGQLREKIVLNTAFFHEQRSIREIPIKINNHYHEKKLVRHASKEASHGYYRGFDGTTHVCPRN